MQLVGRWPAKLAGAYLHLGMKIDSELTTLSRDCNAGPALSLPPDYTLRLGVANVLRCLWDCWLVYVAPPTVARTLWGGATGGEDGGEVGGGNDGEDEGEGESGEES